MHSDATIEKGVGLPPETVQAPLGPGSEPVPARVPASALSHLSAAANEVGGRVVESPEYQGCVAVTLFDTATSKDNQVTIVIPRENIGTLYTQALVRIHSVEDDKWYLGMVVEGPFSEPDGLPGNAPIIVTASVRGGLFLPPYHGRATVELLGEQSGGKGPLMPARYRPRPHSPVFVLGTSETAEVLKASGDIHLGTVLGQPEIEVGIPSDRKAVLPRHTGILGTTGGGKSNTVARMIAEAQSAGMAVIVLDVEGEYTAIHEPNSDPAMVDILRDRGEEPRGIPNVTVYHLVGRETTAPASARRRPFCLEFDQLSPYALSEILELNEAQDQRFRAAYDFCKKMLARFKVYPATRDEETELLVLDEFERGYPRMTLEHLIDAVRALLAVVESKPSHSTKNSRKRDDTTDDATPSVAAPDFYTEVFRNNANEIMKEAIKSNPPTNASSWLVVLGRLYRLWRLKVFDRKGISPLNFSEMLKPGRVSIVDLSDTSGTTQLNNIVIADILRRLQEEQDRNFEEAQKSGTKLTPALVFVEEAHEFLSAERINEMPILFEQLARIAKRGRKRWLCLAFVTQLPQHLPRQVIGLINNFILHKITDTDVLSRLERVIPGVNKALWDRLPGLAPGQAIVAMGHMTRPLLTAIDPAPCRLRMTE